jgi:hypothetical protein
LIRSGTSQQETSGRAASLTLLLAIVIATAACTYEYPSEDAPYLDVHSLSVTEQVEALNLLGLESEPERRFALLAPCKLQIEEKSGLWRWERRSINLMDVQVLLRARAEERYELVIAGNGSEMLTVVLNGEDSLDMHRSQRLARLLVEQCRASG